jgi:hypothetical protein
VVALLNEREYLLARVRFEYRNSRQGSRRGFRPVPEAVEERDERSTREWSHDVEIA